MRMCDPKIRGRDDSQNRTVRGFFPQWHMYRYIFSGGYLSSFLFFFLSVIPSGLAWLRSAQQRETTRTINDFFRRWANLCVSCDLLLHSPSSLYSSSSSSPSALYRADRELPLSCHASYFTWSKTPSSCSAPYSTWSKTSSFLALRFILRRGWWLHVHVCVCVHLCRWILSAGLLFFFLSLGKGYIESLVTQTERPVPSKTPLSFGYYILPFFRYYTLRCVVRFLFDSYLPSMFPLSPLSLYEWL